MLNERAYEIATQPMLNGISTLASAGQVPGNLKSGEGEKVAIDIHTQRFTPLEQRQAAFAVDAGNERSSPCSFMSIGTSPSERLIRRVNIRVDWT
jgi:hypothetical protein